MPDCSLTDIRRDQSKRWYWKKDFFLVAMFGSFVLLRSRFESQKDGPIDYGNPKFVSRCFCSVPNWV